jgi:hypothetical protein
MEHPGVEHGEVGVEIRTDDQASGDSGRDAQREAFEG